MSDQTKPGGDNGAPSASEAAADAARVQKPESAGSPAAAKPEAQAAGDKPSWADIGPDQMKQVIIHLQKDNEALRAEVEDMKAQKLRLLADMDNLRKRTEREKEEMAKYAVQRFAKDMVDVGDNFQRAIQAVPAKAAEDDAALKSLLDGVTLAERAFLAALERYGVRQIEAEGLPFNPHQHQAVMERDEASVPAGTILQVFQAGYSIEDRCLRPSMVVVAKGGQKAAKAPDAPEAPSAANDPGDGEAA